MIRYTNQSSIINCKKGFILNVVLVSFINILFLISFISYNALNNKLIYNHLDSMFKQKNIEILSLYHYENEYKSEGILLSEEYEIENTRIKSEVETIDSYYFICTYVYFENYEYCFNVKLNLETGKLSDFSYLNNFV